MAPERTCIGCRKVGLPTELIRLSLNDGVVVINHRGGRGAWLHDDPQCAQHAIKKKALARALKTAVDEHQVVELFDHHFTARPTGS